MRVRLQIYYTNFIKCLLKLIIFVKFNNIWQFFWVLNTLLYRTYKTSLKKNQQESDLYINNNYQTNTRNLNHHQPFWVGPYDTKSLRCPTLLKPCRTLVHASSPSTWVLIQELWKLLTFKTLGNTINYPSN